MRRYRFGRSVLSRRAASATFPRAIESARVISDPLVVVERVVQRLVERRLRQRRAPRAAVARRRQHRRHVRRRHLRPACRIASRSTMFASSRTFPGHRCRVSSAIASSLHAGAGRPVRVR